MLRPSLCCRPHNDQITPDEQFSPRLRLTEVGACELGQDAEGAGLGGAGAGLPVLGVLDQPLLAAVIGDKAGQVLHPEAVPAHGKPRLTQSPPGRSHQAGEPRPWK